MSRALELAHTFQDLVTPNEATSKLTFTKYNGDAILKYIQHKIAITKNDKTTVTLILNPEAIELKEEVVPDVTYEDIGGLSEEIKKIREF